MEVVEQTGDPDMPFRWASVTKLLVALAVLVATEEGILGLDDPAGPPGSTVRHLLAHASGLGPDSPEPLSAPGRRRIYSNVGYEMLAEVVTRAPGMPFADYLTSGVIAPLRMTGTALAPGSSPASGAHGPVRDLLALAAELLAPRLVAPSTLAGPPPSPSPVSPASSPASAGSTPATGAWASRSATTRPRTGPDRTTRPPPSAISGNRAASCGSTPSLRWRARRCATGTSARGRRRRGPPSPTP